MKSYLFLLFGLLYFVQDCTAQTFISEQTRVRFASQYYFNQLLYNPAYAGDKSQASVGLFGQMAKFNNRKPLDAGFYAQGQVDAIKSGIGLIVQYHNFDNFFTCGSGQQCDAKERILKIGLTHNYKLDLADDMSLRLGIGAALLHYNSARPPAIGSVNPPTVFEVNAPFFKVAIDIGVLFNVKDFRAGFGIKNTNEPEFQFYSSSNSGQNPLRRDVFLSLNYQFHINELWNFGPSMMLSQQLGSSGSFNSLTNRTFLDLSFLANYYEIYYAGLSYKLNDDPFGLAFMLGARIADTYQISLSMDMKTQKQTNTSRFELSLGIFLNNYADEEEDLEESIDWKF